MRKLLQISVAALAVMVTVGAFAFAQDDNTRDAKKPKHTVKQVMAETMHPKGDKLNKKVLSGEATDEEKQKLLDLFVSLTENDPPTGDEASWQTFSNAAAIAAAKVVVGREGAIKELKTATNCKKCHDAHKPAN